MKLLNKLFILTVLVAVAGSGCKKLNLAPTDRFTDLTFWQVDGNVYSALYNDYSIMYIDNLYFTEEAVSDNAFSSSGDVTIISSGNGTPLTGRECCDR